MFQKCSSPNQRERPAFGAPETIPPGGSCTATLITKRGPAIVPSREPLIRAASGARAGTSWASSSRARRAGSCRSGLAGCAPEAQQRGEDSRSHLGNLLGAVEQVLQDHHGLVAEGEHLRQGGNSSGTPSEPSFRKARTVTGVSTWASVASSFSRASQLEKSDTLGSPLRSCSRGGGDWVPFARPEGAETSAPASKGAHTRNPLAVVRLVSWKQTPSCFLLDAGGVHCGQAPDQEQLKSPSFCSES